MIRLSLKVSSSIRLHFGSAAQIGGIQIVSFFVLFLLGFLPLLFDFLSFGHHFIFVHARADKNFGEALFPISTNFLSDLREV